MTRRLDELRTRSFNELLNAVERGDDSAKAVLTKIQRLRKSGEWPGTRVIQYSPHHGWILRNLLGD